jgi:serpin B
MAEALGMADFTETEINEYYQKMSQSLLTVDPSTEIGIANSIWCREGLPVKLPFINVNQKYFDAQVEALDFSSPDASKIINDWCAEKTKDLIKDIVPDPIPDDVVMFLINALYFKSKWQLEFGKKNTKQDDFVKADNSKIPVNLMEQTGGFPRYADEYLQCVEMNYGNGAFSMMVVLPADNLDIDQLIEHLDETKWRHIIANTSYQNVWLKLPRFKIECEMGLNEPVKRAGMNRIFNGGLYNISDWDLRVSDIRQKTFVEVNEEGTEAAAVTTIAITDCDCPPPPVVPFHANRPFLYLITEKSTGAILFIGRMDEPKE